MRPVRIVAFGAVVLLERDATVFQVSAVVMVNFPGRNGRRRRVLNEEILSVSSGRAARVSSADHDTSQAPRYSDAAGVENHPQVTDFIPRKYRSIGMFVTTGVATTVVLGALDYFAPTIASVAGMPTLRPFDVSAPGSIAAWLGAVVLFLASVSCLLVYSIRRHRIDDFRGRYRIWFAAGMACLVLSANSVAGLHHVLANGLSNLTGWSALRDGGVWWVALAGLPLLWIAVRVLLDVRECRLATALMVVAGIGYTTAVANHFGVAGEQQNASMITGVTALLGNWLAFAGVISYARFVILDAQGLIEIRQTKPKRMTQESQSATKAGSEANSSEENPSVLSVVKYAQSRAKEAEEDDDRWVDGRRPERKRYRDFDDEVDEESSDSKMSKSDRKRQRKLKAQNRAA